MNGAGLYDTIKTGRFISKGFIHFSSCNKSSYKINKKLFLTDPNSENIIRFINDKSRLEEILQIIEELKI